MSVQIQWIGEDIWLIHLCWHLTLVSVRWSKWLALLIDPPPPELDASLLQVPHSILSVCLFSLPGTQLYTGYTPGWRKALQCFSWDSVLCDNTQKPQPVISFFSAGEISWHLALSYILEIITSFFCSIFFCPKQCLGINWWVEITECKVIIPLLS